MLSGELLSKERLLLGVLDGWIREVKGRRCQPRWEISIGLSQRSADWLGLAFLWDTQDLATGAGLAPTTGNKSLPAPPSRREQRASWDGVTKGYPTLGRPRYPSRLIA